MKIGIVVSIIGIIIGMLILNKQNMSTIDHGRIVVVHINKTY